MAELVLGFGAGLNGTPAIYAALGGVAPSDTGVASAMSSTSNRIGASIGTAALSSIAAGATASYVTSHPVGSVAGFAIVHGFTTATAAGALVLLAGAEIVGLLVDADPRARPDRREVDSLARNHAWPGAGRALQRSPVESGWG